MPKTIKAWRLGFVLAALFNVLVGVPMVLAPDGVAALLGTAAADPLQTRLLGWMIAVFGFGYLMVARDLRGQRGIVVLGIIGKAGVIAIAGVLALRGLIPISVPLLASGDLAFVLMFVAFLRSSRA